MRLLIDREIREQSGSLSEVPMLAPPLAEHDGTAAVLRYADRSSCRLCLVPPI
jgi:hypothetical protein